MRNRNDKHTAIIGMVLAGGQSTRMGTDKALLHINAQTMIERSVNVLKATSVDRVVVSRNIPPLEPLQVLDDVSTNQLADIIPHKGPLSGIHSIVTRFPQYNVVVLPVDLPLMDAKTIQQLINCGVETSKNVRYKEDNLPLFIHNTKSLREILDYTLRYTDCYSVARFCSHFPIVELNNKRRSKTFNANTPEQWRYAMQHFSNGQSVDNKEDIHESFK